MLKELLLDHESLVVVLRKSVTQIAGKINDAGTADFLTGLMEDHESIAWVLRRYQE
jgi:starvation-inducible DNA-binding protein